MVQRRSKVRAVLLDYNGGDSRREVKRISEEILALVTYKDKRQELCFFSPMSQERAPKQTEIKKKLEHDLNFTVVL